MTAPDVQPGSPSQRRTRGLVLAVAGASLFSLKGVVIKLAFAEGVGVFQLLTLRMAFALPVYMLIGLLVFARSRRRPGLRLYLMAGGLGVMSYYLSSWLNLEGLRYVSAQLERLILYIYPTIVALLAFVFLRKPVTRNHVIALLLAYAGVAVLFAAEIGHQGPDALMGGGLIFAGAVIYAIYVTASSPVIAGMGASLFTAFGMSVASIAFLTQSGVQMAFEPLPPVSPAGYWLALVLAIVCTVIPSFMISASIATIGPGPTSAAGGIGPVVAAWAAVMVLNEPFGWPHMAAMILTIAGVWLLSRPSVGPPAASDAS